MHALDLNHRRSLQGGSRHAPAGQRGYENEANERGEHYVWLEARWVDKLSAMRGKGESYSDVIIRVAGVGADSLAGRNEGKALDAVLRFIETRDSALRENDGRSLDEHPDPLRRVDYVCTVGQTLYAFEHTRIEPFPNQIRLADHNQKLFDPIIERFDHRTDREVWDLYVPAEASATVNDVCQVQQALIKWIDANWERIPVAPRYGRPANRPLGESDGDVPFRFSPHRTSSPVSDSPLDGRFFLRPIAPANLEQQRVARLQTAYQRKSPKLAKWKQDSGARTVLVLEEDDLWLTNHFGVAEALVPAEATTPDAPDEVFLVSTGVDQTWWVV